MAVGECILESLTGEAISDTEVTVGQVVVIPFAEFVMQPACAFALTYSLTPEVSFASIRGNREITFAPN